MPDAAGGQDDELQHTYDYLHDLTTITLDTPNFKWDTLLAASPRILTENTKDLTVRVNKITTILKNTLDLEKGGQIAKHLMHLYNHIQYASVRVHDHKDFSAINSAYKVVKEINEGWTKLAKEAAA